MLPWPVHCDDGHAFPPIPGGHYYARCTALRVPPGPGLVLLEVATNLWGSPDSIRGMVIALVRAVRRVAPAKAVAFALWPAHKLGLSAIGGRGLQEVRGAAASVGADLLDMSHILNPRVLSFLTRSRFTPADYFRDNVHPSRYGHALFAAIVARFLVQGLILGTRTLCEGHGGPDSVRAVRSLGQRPPNSTTEQCYERAGCRVELHQSQPPHFSARQAADQSVYLSSGCPTQAPTSCRLPGEATRPRGSWPMRARRV